MRTEIFNPANGDRLDFANVAVLITDGEPTREVEELDEEVMRIKRRNIGIVGVGVTKRVSNGSHIYRVIGLFMSQGPDHQVTRSTVNGQQAHKITGPSGHRSSGHRLQVIGSPAHGSQELGVAVNTAMHYTIYTGIKVTHPGLSDPVPMLYSSTFYYRKHKCQKSVSDVLNIIQLCRLRTRLLWKPTFT